MKLSTQDLDYLNIVNLKLNNTLSFMRSEACPDTLSPLTPILLQVDDDIESIIESLHRVVVQLENTD